MKGDKKKIPTKIWFDQLTLSELTYLGSNPGKSHKLQAIARQKRLVQPGRVFGWNMAHHQLLTIFGGDIFWHENVWMVMALTAVKYRVHACSNILRSQPSTLDWSANPQHIRLNWKASLVSDSHLHARLGVSQTQPAVRMTAWTLACSQTSGAQQGGKKVGPSPSRPDRWHTHASVPAAPQPD